MIRRWLCRYGCLCFLFLTVGMVSPAAAKILTVAVDREYAPYEFQDRDGVVQGFTPDLLRALGTQGDWKPVFKPMAWPEAIAALEAGRVDLINMIRSPERARDYAFSLPHSTIDQSLFCNRSRHVLTNLDQLKGLTVAFQQGDVSAEKLAGHPGLTPRLVTSKNEGFLLLLSGHVDAFFAATQPGIHLIQKDGLKPIIPGMTGLFPLDFCFAARKDRAGLIQQLNESLLTLEENGTHAALVKKWLSASVVTPGWQQEWAPYLLAGVLLFALALLLMWVWSKALSRKIELRTHELANTINELNASKDVARSARRHSLSLLEMGGVLLVGFGRDGEVTFLNRELQQMLQADETELADSPWLKGHLSEDGWQRLRDRSLEDEAGDSDPIPALLHNFRGDEVIIHWNVKRLSESPDGRTCVLCAGHDMTAQCLVEETLREQEVGFRMLEQQFRATLDAVSDPILVLDRDRVVLWSNAAAQEQESLIAKAGMSCHQYFFGSEDHCDECLVQRCLEKGQPLSGHQVNAGSRVMEVSAYPIMDAEGEVVRVVEMAKDVSAQLRRQNERYHAGQLVAVGELATGIAHEINNPINGIINYAQILKGLCHDLEKPRNLAGRIQVEAERIAHIVANLLSFTRRDSGEAGPVHLQEVVADTLILVGAKVRNEGIGLSVRIPDGLPTVYGSSRELQQVLINLLSNARYAVREKYHGEQGGQIEVAASKSRGNISLVIKDNGCGIEEEILPRIKESFFTTKPEGEGSGLGLSICEDLLKSMDGSFEIQSEAGSGTRVLLSLPQSTAAVPASDNEKLTLKSL